VRLWLWPTDDHLRPDCARADGQRPRSCRFLRRPATRPGGGRQPSALSRIVERGGRIQLYASRSYLGRKLHGQVNRSAVWSVTETEECLRWPLRGPVTAASQHRACTARPGGEPAVRKPRTVALPAGSPLAAGAAAAHDPPRPIQPGGRAKQRERDPQPSDRREAERGYAHALTWSSGTIIGWSTARPPSAGESPPGGQRRRPGKRAFLLTPAGGMMSHPTRQAIRRSASSRPRGSGSRLGWPRAAPAAAWKAAATAGPQATVTSTGPDARAGP
jgi:hypothetical protein